jgi:hypothetical protein
MVGLVSVKVMGVHIPHLADVNAAYWKHNWKERELEGLGYVCPSCDRIQIVKTVNVDEGE